MLSFIERSVIGSEEKTKVKAINWQMAAWLSAAAVIILISILTFFNQDHKATTSAINYVVKKAGTGELVAIRLPDSSLIYLSAGSSIKFPERFEELSRDVYLEGEAFFSVTRHTDKPFIVHAGALHTRVLGTRFKVISYKSLPHIDVQVEEGKVQVSDKFKVLRQLKLNETLNYEKQTGDFVAGISSNIAISDFARGHIWFKNASFDELKLRIRNYYGYNLHTKAEAIINGRFTADLYITQPVSAFMSKFSSVYGKSYTIKGKEIIIR